MSIVVTQIDPITVMFRVDGEAGPIDLFAANLLTGAVTSAYLSSGQCAQLGAAVNKLRENMPVDIGGVPAIVSCGSTALKSLFAMSGLNLGFGPYTLQVAVVSPTGTVRLGSFQNIPGTPEYFLFRMAHSINGPFYGIPAEATGVP